MLVLLTLLPLSREVVGAGTQGCQRAPSMLPPQVWMGSPVLGLPGDTGAALLPTVTVAGGSGERWTLTGSKGEILFNIEKQS